MRRRRLDEQAAEEIEDFIDNWSERLDAADPDMGPGGSYEEFGEVESEVQEAILELVNRINIYEVLPELVPVDAEWEMGVASLRDLVAYVISKRVYRTMVFRNE